MKNRGKRNKTLKKQKTTSKISASLYKKYDALSPFEIKDKLTKMASSGNKAILNSGRGNPNFFNNFVRIIFAKLQLLVLNITDTKGHLLKDLDVFPEKDDFNYDKLFRKGAQKWNKNERDFFYDYLSFIKKKCIEQKKNYNHEVYDILLSTLGTYYPVPPQMQPHLNFTCQEFMYDLFIANARGDEEGTKLKPDDFEFFATEGAAAGILYVFNTLKENFLLNAGDTIAIITPIFSPYLEMPKLADYDLKIIELKGNPEKNYALDDDEINKLRNKKIKGLFMVNPANPGAFALPKDNIDKIGKLINTERPDIFVLNDSVYSPFVKRGEYSSFMLTCPKNTIEVYSLSKYFGTTGWRLGIVAIPKDTNLNKMIWNLPAKQKTLLHKRYELNTIDPDKLTFMTRLVYDSRAVSEAHVAGLSTPQQVIMGLFLYYDLHDKGHGYQIEIRELLEKRIYNLYSHLNTKPHMVPVATDYYTLLDIPIITENLFGKKARDNLVSKHNYIEFIFHLAKKYNTIVLPGKGFGTLNSWVLRVSLANLPADDYIKIGINIAKCINDFT